MARFQVAWEGNKNTLHIVKAGAKETRSKTIVGDIFLPVVGEIPDAAPHPEPGEHLKNLARKQGFEDYRLVSVVNDTDHEGFDRFAKEVDEDYLAQHERREDAKIVAGGGARPADQDPGSDVTEEDRMAGTLASETKDGVLEGPTP